MPEVVERTRKTQTHVTAAADWREAILDHPWTPWFILGLAAAIRFLLLGMKPPHFDEGINGWFVDQMVRQGFYNYDPTNYHGPLHFYVLLLSESLFGRNLWALRLPVVLVSIASVWLTLRFEPLFGRALCRLAALAMAVSPGFVFYGRYSIHEVWLLLFNMMLMLGLLGLWRIGTTRYLWYAGLGLAGMILTKETYIIHLGCALIAFPVALVSQLITPAKDFDRVDQSWRWFDLIAVIATGLFLIIFFYSGTFYDWDGVKGLYQTFGAWFETGHKGNGHEKAWWYWLMLIGRYEIPIALGLLFCALAQTWKDLGLRYLAIYGVGVLMAYSIVNYKTPWCIISMVWPFFFIFGAFVSAAPMRFTARVYAVAGALLAAAAVFAFWINDRPGAEGYWIYVLVAGAILLAVALPWRGIAMAAASLALLTSLAQSIRLNYYHATTDTEPYVYVQTYNDIFKLTRPVQEMARRDRRHYHMVGHIMRDSSYPLPWMLGDFTRIGYYESGNLPSPVDADFLLVQESKIPEVEAKLTDAYFSEMMRIRAYQDQSKLYFRVKLFQPVFPGRNPDFHGRGKEGTAPQVRK